MTTIPLKAWSFLVASLIFGTLLALLLGSDMTGIVVTWAWSIIAFYMGWHLRDTMVGKNIDYETRVKEAPSPSG